MKKLSIALLTVILFTACVSKKKYLELEKIFLKIAKIKNKLPADLDLEIWNAYSIG